MILEYLSVGPRPTFTVEATVTRACPQCGHSGWINNKYHEDHCPKCGAERPPTEPRGMIYSTNPWWLLKRKLKRLIGRD
jgi:RNA polymerase subunit RPABC4/transcription elongation factor Spt4